MLLSELKTTLASHETAFYRLFLSAEYRRTNVAKFVAQIQMEKFLKIARSKLENCTIHTALHSLTLLQNAVSDPNLLMRILARQSF